MIIRAELPGDRVGEGKIWIEGEERTAWRCRGKADNAAAASHGNPHRSPVRPFGDHPSGTYTATQVDKRGANDKTFGPWRIHIQPVEGECVAREDSEPGDDGIMIHGGALQADGVSLRATHGCLRVDNATADILAERTSKALKAGKKVVYRCAIAG